MFSIYHAGTDLLYDLKDRFKNLCKGYGFIQTYYYSDSKKAIARKVLPVLKSYRKLLLQKKNWSLPTWVAEEGEQLSEEGLNARWLSYIDQMIFAFHLMDIGSYHNEKEGVIDEGLMLFARYYRHMWD